MYHVRNILTNTGRVVEIDQRIDPKGYHKLYQRKWRREHPHYYRDLKRKKKDVQDMQKLNEIQNACNIFISKSIELEYSTSSYNEDEIKKLADDVTNKITNYLEEISKENEVNDAKE